MPPAQLRARQRFGLIVHEMRTVADTPVGLLRKPKRVVAETLSTYPRPAAHPAVHRAGPPRCRPRSRRFFLASRGDCLEIGVVEELKGGAGHSDHHVLLESRGPCTQYPSARKGERVIV